MKVLLMPMPYRTVCVGLEIIYDFRNRIECAHYSTRFKIWYYVKAYGFILGVCFRCYLLEQYGTVLQSLLYSVVHLMSSPRRSWIHDLDHGSMTFFPESSVGSGEVPGGVQGNLG